jgi:hypothetical protein
MGKEVAEAYVNAKMERPDISLALYQVSAEVGGPALVKRVGLRSRKALEAMLRTATDTDSAPDPFAINMMFAAMAGATRSVIEAGASPAMVRKLRDHLVLLCQSYLVAVTASASGSGPNNS